jgi:hypothetical protein
MSRLILAVSLVAAVAVAACGATPIEPSRSPSVRPPASPSIATPPSTVTPPPSVIPQPASPGSLADFTAAERYLFDGVLRGAVECQPAGGSDELPRDAIAGIECNSNDLDVARVGFYLFENDTDMLQAYRFQMEAEGVALDSGSCRDGEHEGAYTPGDGFLPNRQGCFLNDEDRASYRATLPTYHVSIAILGARDDMGYLEEFAWLGNQDTPGNPTLWGPRT